MSMKKIIALALALCMALSMVAFAGYTDADSIESDLTGDVELVTALGIMTGNTDGTFNPTGTMTRAEMAVIAYRLSSGKTTIDESWGDAELNKFTDMDHWSAPYVNYCAALGLVEGNPDGTYRPEDKVTAAQMAKVLLCAAGYSSEKQGYGKNWPMVVLADATTSGLLDGYEKAFTGAASREWVAKMIANLIKEVDMVEYSLITGALTNPKELGTFGEEKYNVANQSLIAYATKNVALSGKSNTDFKTGEVLLGEAKVKASISDDMLGRKFKVYFQDSEADGTTEKGKLNNGEKVYAVVDVSNAVTTTLNKLELKKATVDNVEAKYLHIDGELTKGVLDDIVHLYVNITKDEVAKLNGMTATKIADGREVVLLDNDNNGKYETIMMNEVKYGTVTDLDMANKTVTVNIDGGSLTITEKSTPIKWEQLNLIDTIAEDDVIRYEVTLNAKGKPVYNISKLNALRTKITSATPDTTNKLESTFTVGDTTYGKSDLALTSFNLDTFVKGLNKTALKNNTYDIYTDGSFVVFAELYEGNVVSGLNLDVCYLIDSQTKKSDDLFATSKDINYVQVLLNTGDIAVYEYKDPADSVKNGVKYENLGAEVTIYELILNDDATAYFKTATAGDETDDTKAVISDKAVAGYTAMDSASKSFLTIDTDVKLFADENTFFFVKKTWTPTGKTKPTTVYTVVKASEIAKDSVMSKDASDWGNQIAYIEDKTTGMKTLAYAAYDHDAENIEPAAKPVTGEWFIATKAGTEVVTADGSTWEVEGYNALGEATTIVITKNDEPVKAGKLYAITTTEDDVELKPYFTTGSDGNYDDNAADNDLSVKDSYGKWYAARISATNGSAVVLNDQKGTMLDVADDATILMVSYTEDTPAWTVKTTELKYDADAADKAVFVLIDENGVVTTIIMGQSRADSDTAYARVKISTILKY